MLENLSYPKLFEKVLINFALRGLFVCFFTSVYNMKPLDFIKLWLVDWSLKINLFFPMDIYKL